MAYGEIPHAAGWHPPLFPAPPAVAGDDWNDRDDLDDGWSPVPGPAIVETFSTDATSGRADAEPPPGTMTVVVAAELRSGAPEPRELLVILVRCRGVQVGNRNHQINTYFCKIRIRTAHLDDVLSRTEVVAALRILAADPDDPALWQAARMVLGENSRSGTSEDAIRFRPLRQPRVVYGSSSFGLGGRVIAIGSRGVQIGDHRVQRNRVHSELTADVDGRYLFSAEPGLIDAFLEGCLSGDSSRLDVQLQTILSSPSLLLSAGLPDTDLSRPGRLTATGVEGGQFGNGNQVEDHVHVRTTKRLGRLTRTPDPAEWDAASEREAPPRTTSPVDLPASPERTPPEDLDGPTISGPGSIG